MAGPRRGPRARRSSGIGAVLLLSGAVTLGACSDEGGGGDTTAVTLPDETAILEAGDQGAGEAVTVAHASLPEPGGYVAVYEASNDAPGRRLGASELLATGEHDDIEVELTESPEPGSDLFLMLHGEGGGDADLQHPGPDEPLADDGRILTIRITVE